MKLTGTYNGKQIELELTEEQVESLILNRKKTGWERVKEGETFWCAGTTDTAFEFQEVSSCRDDRLFSDANYFSNATLTQNIIKAQELQRKLWRRSAELCEKVDWRNPETEKYCIRYDYDDDDLCVDFCVLIRGFGEIYFDTEEHAEQVIKEFRDELIWYFTKFESRMD